MNVIEWPGRPNSKTRRRGEARKGKSCRHHTRGREAGRQHVLQPVSLWPPRRRALGPRPSSFSGRVGGFRGEQRLAFFANDVIGHPNCSAPPLTPLTGESPVPKKWKEGTRRGTRKSATIGAPARQRPRSSPRREQDCTSSQTIPTTPPTRNFRPPSTTAQFSLQTFDRLGGTTFAPLLHGFLHPVDPSIPTLPHSKKGYV